MALTVEDGTGSPDSEAYASVAFADGYLAARGGPSATAWVALTIAQKEAAMRNGAEYLDLTYERRIPGRRVNEDQSLAFPRYDLQDPYTGFAIPHDEVPVNLKRANVEAAVRADDEKATGGGLGPVSSGLVVQEFDKVGPLETARVYAAGTVVRTDGTASRKYPKIEALMARYFQTGVIERA